MRKGIGDSRLAQRSERNVPTSMVSCPESSRDGGGCFGERWRGVSFDGPWVGTDQVGLVEDDF